jgi:FkbM family methyltransferase
VHIAVHLADKSVGEDVLLRQLKLLVKPLVPPRQRRQLGLALFALQRAQARVIAAIAGAQLRGVLLLPPVEAVRVKEGIDIVRPLDYSRSTIFTRLISRTQFNRLAAQRKEPETVAWIESQLRPGDVFYDVGANIGAYSLIAHTVTEGRCQIYAFEPSFSTFAALCDNVFLNRFQESIVPLNVVLSDFTGLAPFAYSKLAPGAALHNQVEQGTDLRAETGEPSLVQVMPYFRLDDLVELLKLPLPTHVKIDVDGHEAKVIRGAARTLSSHAIRSILVEIDEGGYENQAIADWMEKHGFELESRSQRVTDKYFNWIFIRKEQVAVAKQGTVVERVR